MLKPWRAASARNGAPLVVRIDYLTLGPNSGTMLHAAATLDNINGVAIIGGQQIPVRATTSFYTIAHRPNNG